MMAKLRIVFGEVEGDDAAVNAAIRVLSEALNGKPPSVAVQSPIIAPAQIAAPLKRGRGRPRKTAAIGPGQDSGAMAACLESLKKGGKTSGEILATVKASAPSIYSALSILRKQGRIVSRADEVDGQRKNFLAG